ncbi:MAG TPA: chemotaxis protein CheD [Thermoanaerobaculia bacterium]|jgi:chemotaxis protein CheD|nr:chemotaxis protein CheD [Thermoanaerobaculia bacterium]
MPVEVPRIASRFLQPGHLVIATEPMQVTTILGSCVAVCMFDTTKRVGGINHFMLPLASGRSASSARFGDVAMNELLNGVRDAGGRLPFIQARVFGGASMFTEMKTAASLGQKNVELALDFLARVGIDVIEIDTGGNRGRKLIYRTDEGTVCLKSI